MSAAPAGHDHQDAEDRPGEPACVFFPALLQELRVDRDD